MGISPLNILLNVKNKLNIQLICAHLVINMFFKGNKKSKTSSIESNTEMSENKEKNKFDFPKVLLIDCDSQIKEVLENSGYYVKIGSFGSKHATIGKGVYEIHFNFELSYLEEYDIILIDNKRPEIEPDPKLKEKKELKATRVAYLSIEGQNYFDPRPIVGNAFRKSFDTILKKGGIIVVFCSSEYSERYNHGKINNGNLDSYSIEEKSYSNYSFLPIRSYSIEIPKRRTIKVTSNTPHLVKFIQKNIDSFSAELAFHVNKEKEIPFALDDFDNAVSKVYIDLHDNREAIDCGKIVYIPRSDSFSDLIPDFFNETLPILSPNLFPHVTNNSWLNSDEYLMPSVKDIIKERDLYKKEVDKRLLEFDLKLEKEKQKYAFLFNILSSEAYDSFLVNNLIQFFKEVGIPKAKNADDGKEKNLEEDIQIEFDNNIVVVEVKGLAGLPTESDCNQVLKYILRQQKKLNRTDILGLFIVNHQRNLPPFQRSENPFTQTEIDDAINSSYSLTTTWELYKAYKLYSSSQLNSNDIFSSITKPGLVEFFPKNWIKLGKVDHIYPKINVARILIQIGDLKVNDEIGYFDGRRFFSFKVENMQLDQKDITTADVSILPGIKFPSEIRAKYDLFKIAAN